jgi:hypothetical protein
MSRGHIKDVHTPFPKVVDEFKHIIMGTTPLESDDLCVSKGVGFDHHPLLRCHKDYERLQENFGRQIRPTEKL